MKVKIELTEEQIESILHALDCQFDMTDNVEGDELNKKLMDEIIKQANAQGVN